MEKFFSAAPAPVRATGKVRSPNRQLTAIAALMVAALNGTSSDAQPPVLQRGYDAGVSGATLSETTLTTSNVRSATFGLVFKLAVNDNILAQPLYVPNLSIDGRAHNVLYVATMSDTLYAFDADIGGLPLWTRNLATFERAAAIPTAQFAYSGNRNIVGNLGILSTPVIDLATKTLYGVACTLEKDTIVYRLHAIDITTGVPRVGSGVVIAGSFGSLTFDARNLWQRMSLVLSGNNVVFGFGALELESTAHHYVGWVMAYDKSSLAQTGIFATVTTGNGGGGVWQSGRPPVVDGSGHVYVFTGNAFGGGFDGRADFSESVLKLDPSHGLRRVDYFTPSNWLAMDLDDLDLTSSGPMLIPGTDLLVGGGKTGLMYVLNIHDLGQNSADDTGAVQKIRISASELRGGPVYWQRSSANGGPVLYDWGVDDDLKAFPFNGATFATTPSAHGPVGAIWPGGILTLSAHSDKPGTGVLWATVVASGDAENNPPVPGRLYAFDAANVAHELWNSNMDPARDTLGNLAKFVPPLVASGRVYVATWSKQVAVYGILAPTVASVVPDTGTTGGGTTVTITGNYFVPGAKLTFGGDAATSVVVTTATKMTARTPEHMQGSVNVMITNPSGHSGVRASGFTYQNNLP
jgi:IPT/TIG domain